jgi:hypothetical protein
VLPFDITALLRDWGVTIQLILIAAVVLFAVFFFGFREFAVWYLKINKVSKQLAVLEQRLRFLEEDATRPNADVSNTSAASTPSNDQFKIHKALSESTTSKEPNPFN